MASSTASALSRYKDGFLIPLREESLDATALFKIMNDGSPEAKWIVGKEYVYIMLCKICGEPYKSLEGAISHKRSVCRDRFSLYSDEHLALLREHVEEVARLNAEEKQKGKEEKNPASFRRLNIWNARKPVLVETEDKVFVHTLHRLCRNIPETVYCEGEHIARSIPAKIAEKEKSVEEPEKVIMVEQENNERYKKMNLRHRAEKTEPKELTKEELNVINKMEVMLPNMVNPSALKCLHDDCKDIQPFGSINALGYHVSIKHNKKSDETHNIPCALCDKSSNNWSSLSAHMLRFHGAVKEKHKEYRRAREASSEKSKRKTNGKSEKPKQQPEIVMTRSRSMSPSEEGDIDHESSSSAVKIKPPGSDDTLESAPRRERSRKIMMPRKYREESEERNRDISSSRRRKINPADDTPEITREAPLDIFETSQDSSGSEGEALRELDLSASVAETIKNAERKVTDLSAVAMKEQGDRLLLKEVKSVVNSLVTRISLNNMDSDYELIRSTSSASIRSTDSVKISKARIQKEKPSESAPFESINDKARKVKMSMSVQPSSSVGPDTLQRLPQDRNPYRSEAPTDTRRPALNKEHSYGDAATKHSNRTRNPSIDDQRSNRSAAPKRTRNPSPDDEHPYGDVVQPRTRSPSQNDQRPHKYEAPSHTDTGSALNDEQSNGGSAPRRNRSPSMDDQRSYRSAAPKRTRRPSPDDEHTYGDVAQAPTRSPSQNDQRPYRHEAPAHTGTGGSALNDEQSNGGSAPRRNRSPSMDDQRSYRSAAPKRTRRPSPDDEHTYGDVQAHTRSPSMNDQRSYRCEATMRTRSPSVAAYSDIMDDSEISHLQTLNDEVNRILHQQDDTYSPEEAERAARDVPRMERCASTISELSVASSRTTERKRARRSRQELEQNRLKSTLNDPPPSSSRKRSHFNDDYVFPKQKKNKRKKKSLELSQSPIPPVSSNIGDDTHSERGDEIISDVSESDTESVAGLPNTRRRSYRTPVKTRRNRSATPRERSATPRPSSSRYPRYPTSPMQTRSRASSRASSRGASPVSDFNARSGGFPSSLPPPSLPPPLPTQNMSSAATDEQRQRSRQEPDSEMSLRPQKDTRQMLEDCVADRLIEQEKRLAAFAKPTVVPRNTNPIDQDRDSSVPPSTSSSSMITNSPGSSRRKQNLTQIQEDKSDLNAGRGKDRDPDSYELQLTADQQAIIFSSLIEDIPNDVNTTYSCGLCEEVMPNLAEGRSHAVSHIRVQRMRCRLCNAGSFYHRDLMEHLAQGLCPNMANASKLFQEKVASKRITKEELDYYMEMTDKKNAGRVSYTTGPIVSSKSREPYFPDKTIEEKIIGKRWRSWDEERRKADAEQKKNPVGLPIFVHMPNKLEPRKSEHILPPSQRQLTSTVLPSSSQAPPNVPSTSQIPRQDLVRQPAQQPKQAHQHNNPQEPQQPQQLSQQQLRQQQAQQQHQLQQKQRQLSQQQSRQPQQDHNQQPQRQQKQQPEQQQPQRQEQQQLQQQQPQRPHQQQPQLEQHDHQPQQQLQRQQLQRHHQQQQQSQEQDRQQQLHQPQRPPQQQQQPQRQQQQHNQQQQQLSQHQHRREQEQQASGSSKVIIRQPNLVQQPQAHRQTPPQIRPTTQLIQQPTGSSSGQLPHGVLPLTTAQIQENHRKMLLKQQQQQNQNQ